MRMDFPDGHNRCQGPALSVAESRSLSDLGFDYLEKESKSDADCATAYA
jgi:hypothetical protein